ncbi:hypothetical protein GCM10025868_34820 [Angustibacter aerolatus]|uniref:Glycosyl hydrolase family 36 N-terminal domain-containing protein n=1 Tax=Angustibacter aerolatus TaxID=1162965 RepID=A0ABQ6JN15_9ACTN|nr:alpha-galactosidase [Angustibacter aerolatus]GMA88232.1 hypothetical protein GCM10025868_34820 [Angustibacter aerolatus]
MLDDGWFGSRRDDTSGLGDWTVSPEMWPDGLNPLFDRVRDLGMQVGLWVEPEMVNLDSDLVRAHPDWLLSAPDRLPLVWRNQHVLDVARPEASAHLLERLSALVSEPRHRLPQVGHEPRPARGRAPGARRAVPARRPRPDHGGLPAARGAARAAPRARDRVVRVGRSPHRPRRARAHRPGVGVRHQRRDRAAGDPALDRADPAARA